MRRFLILLLLPVLTVVSVAQTPATELLPDEARTGEIDTQNTARVYQFIGRAGEIINVDASSTALPLALLMTDNQGNVIAQAIDRGASGSTALRNISLPFSGTFLVTVFAAPSGLSTVVGEFEVLLRIGEVEDEVAEPTDVPTIAVVPTEEEDSVISAATQAPTAAVVAPQNPTATPTQAVIAQTTPTPTSTIASAEQSQEIVTEIADPQQILLANGIEVRLTWDAPVDMNLEVRDPVGSSLRFNSRSTPNGGTFGFDANGLCDIISEAPIETATWAPGFLPSGSYEILVFYRQDCEPDTPAPPVQFTINVTVNGNELPPIDASLSLIPNETSVYVANFIVDDRGGARINRGGIYPDSSLLQLPAPPQTLLSNPQFIERGVPVQGAIFEDQDYIVYEFTSNGNEAVSVDMQATSGSLDTLVQVVDANGSLISVNDDADGTTNSFISSQPLPNAGRYYIVATRYGKELGGTEGNFQLTLSQGEITNVPTDVQELGLQAGDVQVVLTWDTLADLQLLVRDPLGVAVFDDRPTITSGGILAADGNVNCTAPTTNPVSYIYWPFGFLRPGTYEVEVWYQNDCDDFSPVEFTLTVLVDGEPVSVTFQRPLEQARYVTSFTINNDRSAQAGPGGFIGGNSQLIEYQDETPTPINFGQTITGSITQNNAFDVYSFQAQAGQVLTIQMAAISSGLDTKLFLISPSGFEIAENDDADTLIVGERTTDSLINAVTLPETGQYRLIATRFASIYGGTTGNYAVSVQTVGGANG